MKLKLTIVVAAVLSVCSCFARGRGPEHHHGGGGGSAHHSSHCGPRSARLYGHHHGWHGRPHYGWHGKPHHGWHGGCHRYHSGSYWYGGGDYLWPEIVGGVVGGALYEAVTYPAETVVVEERPAVITRPTIIQQPVVVEQSVVSEVQTVVGQTVPEVEVEPPKRPEWMNGRYVDEILADGTIVRVWESGHYQTLTE